MQAADWKELWVVLYIEEAGSGRKIVIEMRGYVCFKGVEDVGCATARLVHKLEGCDNVVIGNAGEDVVMEDVFGKFGMKLSGICAGIQSLKS